MKISPSQHKVMELLFDDIDEADNNVDRVTDIKTLIHFMDAILTINKVPE